MISYGWTISDICVVVGLSLAVAGLIWLVKWINRVSGSPELLTDDGLKQLEEHRVMFIADVCEVAGFLLGFSGEEITKDLKDSTYTTENDTTTLMIGAAASSEHRLQIVFDWRRRVVHFLYSLAVDSVIGKASHLRLRMNHDCTAINVKRLGTWMVRRNRQAKRFMQDTSRLSIQSLPNINAIMDVLTKGVVEPFKEQHKDLTPEEFEQKLKELIFQMATDHLLAMSQKRVRKQDMTDLTIDLCSYVLIKYEKEFLEFLEDADSKE